jgi:MGT family glycosyltransferase
MNNLHIAILNQTTPAHVNPTLAVVETLARRGHRVSYVISELYASEVTRLGGEVVLSPRFEFPFNQPSDPAAPVSKQYCTDVFDFATRTLTAVRPFYERHVPDVILFDPANFAGLVLAEQLSVPTIRMTPGLTYEKECLDHASLTAGFREHMIRLSNRVDDFYHRHGINRKDELFIGREPSIHFYLQELRLIQLPPREDELFAPRCPAERLCRERWQSKRPAGKRAALISSSTMYEQGPAYYRSCLEALSELQLHCILALGASIDLASFGNLPANCEVVQGIPQIVLMPHVDVMVCLGGLTTVMEALYHGLPLVMLTHGKAHAEVYANDVEKHGLGIHLKGPHPTAESVRSCVARAMGDAPLNMRVKEAQQRVRSSAGAEEVANWIEHHLERSHTSLT